VLKLYVAAAVLADCCHRMCYFVDPHPWIVPARTPQMQRACEVIHNEGLEPNLLTSSQNGPTPNPGLTALRLEIKGMDCTDSVPNVARVPRPPPIHHNDQDKQFYRQTPATIPSSPSAIAVYLARAEAVAVWSVSFFEGKKPLRRDVLTE
jgi:hypothetical protein